MRNLNNIEANAILILAELEQAIIKGYSLPASVIIQMNALKTAIVESDKELGKDLEELYKQSYKK